MSKYVLRRIVYMIPILLGVTLLTFFLFNVAGGDPAAHLAGKHATQEQIDNIRKELGLDRPLPLQYLHYVKEVLTLDFGRSWATERQINNMIREGIGASVSLTVPAFLLGLLLTVSIALLVAHYRGSGIDKAVMIFCLSAMSLSSLVYILYLQYGLSYLAGVFPISGWDPSWMGRWEYLALPIIIFIILSLGGNILFFRTVFLDEIYQDYVRTARAKGLGTRIILFKHVLRNALIPIITLVVLQMPFLVLGSLLLEAFFSIPGLGGIVYQAIQNTDFPVIKAITFYSALLVMLFQLLTDVLYAVVDPQIKLR